jgi:hypothetical protein
VAYNAADCRALETVFDVLRLLVRSDESKPVGSYPLVKVPNLVTSYSRPDWREFAGIDPVLNEINRAAQWDYQRDRIFLRSKTKGAAKRVLPASVHARPDGPGVVWSPNKEVTDEQECGAGVAGGVRRGQSGA